MIHVEESKNDELEEIKEIVYTPNNSKKDRKQNMKRNIDIFNKKLRSEKPCLFSTTYKSTPTISPRKRESPESDEYEEI